MRRQKALMPDKPFFMYYAPPAQTHAPHHGAEGMDRQVQGPVRRWLGQAPRRTFARQKALGVIPWMGAATAAGELFPAYDDMPEELKPILNREMEVYTAFLEHPDHRDRPSVRHAARPGNPRRHADLLHLWRQRRFQEEHAERLFQ